MPLITLKKWIYKLRMAKILLSVDFNEYRKYYNGFISSNGWTQLIKQARIVKQSVTAETTT